MPHTLEYHERLTAVVGWDKELVTAPTVTDRAMETATSNWPLLIPIPVLLFVFWRWWRDRKSTRLNSSHTVISYAVFCLKKKKTHGPTMHTTRRDVAPA